jgi:hypothetical protein
MNSLPQRTSSFTHLFVLASLAALAVLPAWPADSKPQAVAHEVFRDGYFVSNRYHPDQALTLAVFTDRQNFDQAFGVARVMGKPPRFLPGDAFEKQIVAAAIHRGKMFWNYQVNKVEAEGGVVTIHYRTETRAGGSASFACPLIVLLPRADFTTVKFVENDKPLGEAAVKR